MAKRKMKKGRGRRKGNAYENMVAKEIVRRLACFGIKKTDCYRTPSSGGHRYAKKEDPGDLVISKRLRQIFPFSVECKAYKEVDLYPFWRPMKRWGGWPMKKWIAQAVAATKPHTYPMVVFKQNTKDWMAVLPGVYPLIARIAIKMQFAYNGEQWFVVRFDRLMQVIVKENRDAD